MKCVKCESDKLKAYHRKNFDYLLNYSHSKWFYVNPTIQEFVFYSTPWEVLCLDCSNNFQIVSPKKIHSPNLAKFSEIVFDLDHTLFNVEGSYMPLSQEKEAFKFSDPEGRFTYRVFPRPFVKELIEYCISRFECINFFTAATNWYAKELVSYLNIPETKLGFIKSREDTVRGRPLSFDWEALKKMDNMLVVEDKPLVVEGYNNTIFKVTGFYGQSDDKELLDLINYMNQNENKFESPSHISGVIDLFLRDLTIEITNFPSSKYKQILQIPIPSQEHLDNLPIRTSKFESYLVYEHQKAIFSFVDLYYSDYVKLWNIVSPYTPNSLLSEGDFNDLINKKVAKYKRNF